MQYCKVFNEQRIKIGSPGVDLCEVCELAKVHLHNVEDKAFYCPQCAKLRRHKKAANIARELYQKDYLNVPPSTVIYTVDMQKILLLPIMPLKTCFFTKRSVCFNETFACMSGDLDLCIIWHEAFAGRKASDV